MGRIVSHFAYGLHFGFPRASYVKKVGVGETYDSLHSLEIFSKALNLDQLLTLSVSLLASWKVYLMSNKDLEKDFFGFV